VYHQSPSKQVPFTERRTLAKLNQFYTTHVKPPASLSFAGGLTQASTVTTALGGVVTSLQAQARALFGPKYDQLFAPAHATVQLIAWRRQTRPSADRLYILLLPNDAPRAPKQPVIVATITGKRSGPFKAHVATDVKVKEQITRKLREGFEPAPFTDPAALALRDAGYTLATVEEEH
jgi:hypothetical protein